MEVKRFLVDLFQRISSRKFLLTIGGLITLAGSQQWTEFTALVLGYLTAEGAGDVVERLKGGLSDLDKIVNSESHNADDDVDTSTVVTGNTPIFNEELKED